MEVNVGYGLRHPGRVPSGIAYWVWEKLNPDKPWLCRGTIKFCEREFAGSMTGVEFGSGRSTAWFARRVGHLTSVEHDSGWHARVTETLQGEGLTNIDYRLVRLDHPEDEPERSEYDSLPAYVAVLNDFEDESLDLVVVDGHYRTTCILESLQKLKSGGLLLVDDINLWPSPASLPVPDGWPVVDRSSNGIKQTWIWRKPPPR